MLAHGDSPERNCSGGILRITEYRGVIGLDMRYIFLKAFVFTQSLKPATLSPSMMFPLGSESVGR